MWVEKGVTAQELPNKFEGLLNNNGWDTAVKFRVQHGTKYADVRMFNSYGTDYQMRRLGMAFGYDTANPAFVDNRIIADTSSLGMLGIGNGEDTIYTLKAAPVDLSQGFNVLINGAKINDNRYTLTENGTLIFNVAPAPGELITVSYKLSSKAPEPPTFLVFFTYSGINLVSKKALDAPIKLADGDGVTTSYFTPNAPIKAGTLQVWNDSVPQILNEDYKVNLSTGEITFTEPPALGKELTVKYAQIIAGAVSVELGTANGTQVEFYTPTAPIAETKFALFVDNVEVDKETYTVNYDEGIITFNTAPTGKVVARYIDLTGGPAQGQVFIEDIIADKTFDPTTPIGVMDAVYRELDFIQPSLPTVLSFSESGLGNAWQRDSLIHYSGRINRNSAFLHFRADAGANALQAFWSPLYFGRILATHQKPQRNMVLFAGAATSQEIKWKKDMKIGGVNVDYGPKTSNGNSSVQLAQTIGGAYYQAHHLAMMTHSKDADNGEGYFNPSQYLKTERNGIKMPAHVISRMRVVHPNDGYLYELDNIYAMHPKEVVQKDKMEVRELGEWETIGFGDGYKTQFILSRNKHESSSLILQVNCVEIPKEDYTYDAETKTVTFKTPIDEGVEVIAFYGYKQEYQFNLCTAPRCPLVLADVVPYAPMGTLTYKSELAN